MTVVWSKSVIAPAVRIAGLFALVAASFAIVSPTLSAAAAVSTVSTSPGQVNAWADTAGGPTDVPAGLSGVTAIAAGDFHVLALNSNGTVTAWGADWDGQTAVPAGLSGVTAIAAGTGHSLALKSDGTVIAWGANAVGQAHVPADLTNVVGIAAGGDHSLAVKSDGTVVAWGSNAEGESSVPAGLAGVVKVYAGAHHSVALKSDGTVVAWGNNDFNQSSVADGVSGFKQIAVGDYHELGLTVDDTVVAGGANDLGQSTVPTGLGTCKAIAAGGDHSLALTMNGTVVAWGDNLAGQSSVPSGLSGVTAIAAGDSYSIALKSDGTVVVWGGQNASVIPTPSGLSKVHSVSAGRAHTVAVKSDGTVVAWGENAQGQAAVPSGLSGVVAVAAGDYHSLALKADGTVTGWGSGLDGQTSVPASATHVVGISAGDSHSVAVKSDGTVVAWGSNSDGQISVPAGLAGVTAVSAGGNHTLALKSDGTVVAWGSNANGESTVPVGLSGVVAIAAGQNHSLAVKSDGTVVAWGSNNEQQRTVPYGLSNVVAISAGYSQSMALKSDGTVVTWGENYWGRTATVPAGLSNVTAISAGTYTNVAITVDPSSSDLQTATGLNGFVKSADSPVVYLASGGTKHAVPNATVMDAFGGFGKITTVSPGVISSLNYGSKLDREVYDASTGKAYSAAGGKLAPFISCQVASDYAVNCAELPVVSTAFVNSYSAGETINTFAIAGADPAVYLVTGGTKEHVPNVTVMNAFGGFGKMSRVDPYLLARLTTGPDLTTIVRNPADGAIYYAHAGQLSHITSCEVLADYSRPCGGVLISTALAETYPRTHDFSTFVQADGDSAIYLVDNGTKQHITSWAAYLAYGGDAVVSHVDPSMISALPNGPYPVDHLVRVPETGAIYYTANGIMQHVRSCDVLADYRLSCGGIPSISASVVRSFSLGEFSSYAMLPTGPAMYLVTDGLRQQLTNEDSRGALHAWSNSVIDQATFARLGAGPNVSRFIRDPATGAVYFAEDGNLWKVPTCSLLAEYGGSCSTPIPIMSGSVVATYPHPGWINQGVVTDSSVYWFVDNGQKRLVSSQQALIDAGLSTSFNYMSDSSLDYLPQGSNIGS